MRNTRVLALALLALTTGCGEGGFVPPCVPAARPLSIPPPKLATAMHGEFSGRLRIEFIVERDGRVTEPALRSVSLQSDAGGDAPEGYADALLDSVSEWRFHPPLMRCRGRLEMTVSHARTTSA